MNATQVQCEPHDSVVLIKYEHRSAGGSWEEPVSAVRNAPLRRSQRLNSTLDSRTSGQLRNTLSRARELCERWRSSSGATPAPPAPPPDDEGGGRLARWFSVRRGSAHQYDMHTHETDKMPKLPELEEDMFSCGGEHRGGGAGRSPPPALGPPPDDLSPVQLRRRHVVAAIIHSENSYVATLQRLVNDYKKPLEESSPAILNASKIQTLFHRLPDILQCHLHFRTALADCARTWDRDEKIGEVFLNAFSKAVVLDVYSDFINNFSVAMELAKMESKRKSALADFFKVKQISAHDRLSFFGLMVKPVQRFPQFIMFLQDLLKHTPPGHSDRVALQRALTRLEALAEALNERKRDAERTQAFRAALRRLTRGGVAGVAGAGGAGGAARFGAARLLASRADKRHLLRQDDLLQLEFNQTGGISKCKPRRLLLLNDLVVCVSVGAGGGGGGGAGGDDTERLGLKWAHPVQDVDVLDTGTSPTLSRVLAHGMNRSGSLRSTSSNGGGVGAGGGVGGSAGAGAAAGDSLCNEMSALMHDYETVSRMADLAASLRAPVPNLAPDVFRALLLNIQQSIQKKDDEMAWVDSCCLQLTVRGRDEPLTFRAAEPGARLAWATELRLAQLAQAAANSPAWRLPAPQQAPAHKMPLFVAATPVYSSKQLTEVSCGCFYQTSSGPRAGGGGGAGGGMRRARSLVWVGAGAGGGVGAGGGAGAGAGGSHVAVLTHRAAKLKTLVTLDLPDTTVTSIEYAKGVRQEASLCGDTVWLGTDCRRILVFAGAEPERQEKLAEIATDAPVTTIRYHCDAMFVGLADGRLAVYRRGADDAWGAPDPSAPAPAPAPATPPALLRLGDPDQPVHCVLPVQGIVYASCGRRVFVINAHTDEIVRAFEPAGGEGAAGGDRPVRHLAHSGVGLWTARADSTHVSLHHAETFEHLQNIDIAGDVARTIGAREGSRPAHVSALLATHGLLWVGTTAGVSVTVPLPKLEGLPLVGGHAGVSYHAHAGPVTFLLPLLPGARGDDGGAGRRNPSANHAGDGGKEPDKPKLERQASEELSPDRPARALSAVVRRRRGAGGAGAAGDGGRLSKTLPKCANLNAVDVYGLFGDLMFVKDCCGEGDVGGVGGAGGEALRRSDPELAAIPFRVSTLDRRLRMRAGRPRSLDLSSWSVDSRASSLCTSSGSEESMALRGVSRAGSGASAAAALAPRAASTPTPDSASSKSSESERSVSRSDSAPERAHRPPERPAGGGGGGGGGRSLRGADYVVGASALRRSVVTVMGGRGYVDWRQTADAAERPAVAAEPNPRDAHLILWEMRL